MAFVLGNRIWETTATTGTGTVALAGAKDTNFSTFSDQLATSDTTFYFIVWSSGWECGVGTLATSTSLARTTVLDNHVGTTSAQSLPSGSKDVICAPPGGRLALTSFQNVWSADQDLNGNKILLTPDALSYLQGDINANIGFWIAETETARLTGGNTPILRLKNGVTGSANMPSLEFYRDAQISSTHLIGAVDFYSRDNAGSGGNKTQFARVHATAPDVTNGSEDGKIHLSVASSGTLTEVANFTNNVAVFTGASGVRVTDEVTGKTDSLQYGEVGFEALQDGRTSVTTSGSVCLVLNREASDGQIISVRQANSEEGSVTVSGTTVTWGTFTAGHWTEWAEGEAPQVERLGMVVCATDQSFDDRKGNLPKIRLSKHRGEKSVYGVFSHREEDTRKDRRQRKAEKRDDGGPACPTRAHTHSIGVGFVLCRGPVGNGDLLWSSDEPGVAEVQPDDIYRAHTIAKATRADNADRVRLMPVVFNAH